MIKIDLPIIVEGKYDKIKLSSFIQADIIVIDGFGIYHNQEKLTLIRRLAKLSKIILLTDSDRAGFQIRGYLAGIISPEQIIHIYIPEILGKERRKATPGAQGLLGVEGIPAEMLRRAFIEAGVVAEDKPQSSQDTITKEDLYILGLYGGPNSTQRRRTLQKWLELPQGLSANALPGVLSRIITRKELETLAAKLSTEGQANNY